MSRYQTGLYTASIASASTFSEEIVLDTTLDKADYWTVYVPTLDGTGVDLQVREDISSGWKTLQLTSGSAVNVVAGTAQIVQSPGCYAIRFGSSGPESADREIRLIGQYAVNVESL